MQDFLVATAAGVPKLKKHRFAPAAIGMAWSHVIISSENFPQEVFVMRLSLVILKQQTEEDEKRMKEEKK